MSSNKSRQVNAWLTLGFRNAFWCNHAVLIIFNKPCEPQLTPETAADLLPTPTITIATSLERLSDIIKLDTEIFHHES